MDSNHRVRNIIGDLWMLNVRSRNDGIFQMIWLLIIFVLCGGAGRASYNNKWELLMVIFSLGGLISGLMFIYHFGNLVIMCLEKYAGLQ
jgi:hypothetical protein